MGTYIHEQKHNHGHDTAFSHQEDRTRELEGGAPARPPPPPPPRSTSLSGRIASRSRRYPQHDGHLCAAIHKHMRGVIPGARGLILSHVGEHARERESERERCIRRGA